MWSPNYVSYFVILECIYLGLLGLKKVAAVDLIMVFINNFSLSNAFRY